MPQANSGRRVKSHQQMTLALELRARGFSYEKIGQHLSPPVSPPRAWRIVQKGLEFGREKLGETAKNLIQLELNRLNNYRLQLEPKAGENLDPATANALVKIIERECRLTGIDAPTKIAETMPDGSPIQTQEQTPDYSKFSHDELLIFMALHQKAAGDPKWDADLRSAVEMAKLYAWQGKELPFFASLLTPQESSSAL